MWRVMPNKTKQKKNKTPCTARGNYLDHLLLFALGGPLQMGNGKWESSADCPRELFVAFINKQQQLGASRKTNTSSNDPNRSPNKSNRMFIS